MADIATGLTSVAALTGANELAAHEHEVDKLLVQYLHHLDEYTKARDELSKHLTAGFLALADANFTAPRGVRYGQDFYDQRMQASRLAWVPSTGTDHVTSLKSYSQYAADEGLWKLNPELINSKDSQDDRTANEPMEPNGNVGPGRSMDDEKPATAPPDPLRWFGVFVSPKLKATQTHFVQAIKAASLTAVNADTRMKELEIEIRRVRKRMAKSKS